MLQPIKSTQATQATKPTEAGEATESVRPISEQRPGQTLRDRLYELPVISGQKKSAVASGSGQSPSIYQSYSVAKSLPATPITPLPSAAPGSTFSNFANKFTSYADFWAGLGAFQKPEAQKEFVADRWGTAYIDPSLKPYMEKYGLERGVGFLESLARADKLQENRQNPFFTPIMSKRETYFDEDSVNLFKNKYERLGEKGVKRVDPEYALNKSEVAALRKISEDNNLGEYGFQDLLTKAYDNKFLSQTTPIVNNAVSVLSDPYSQNWNDVRNNFIVQDEVSLNQLFQSNEQTKDSGGKSFWASPEWGAIQQALASYQTGASMNAAFLSAGATTAEKAAEVALPWTSWIGPAMFGISSAIMAYGNIKEAQAEKYLDKKIRIFNDDGTMRSTYAELSGPEKDAIDLISHEAKKKGLSKDDIVKALGGVTLNGMVSNLNNVNAQYQKSMDRQGQDGSVIFGESGITLSNKHNPFAAKEA